MTDSSDKDAYTEGLEAQEIRTKLTKWATGAVNHGVDRDWVNGWLTHLGAEPITGQAEYRMNIPITGVYGWRCKASSRSEAAERFLEQVQRLADAGKITADGSYDNVYELKFDEPVTATDVNFYSGPEDVDTAGPGVEGLAALKSGAREMLVHGVTDRNWGYRYAVKAAEDMGLEPLPALATRTVEVPVSGTVLMSVRMFEDADDAAVQRVVANQIKKQGGNVAMKPEEMGTPKLHVKANAVRQNEDDIIF